MPATIACRRQNVGDELFDGVNKIIGRNFMAYVVRRKNGDRIWYTFDGSKTKIVYVQHPYLHESGPNINSLRILSLFVTRPTMN